MKRSFLKVCMASLVLACGGLATGLSGCSSDDAKNDGGPDANGGPDTSTTDTGIDTGVDTGTDGGLPVLAKLTIVHASPAIGYFRFCFAVNGVVGPLPALPHDANKSGDAGFPVPGVPPGSGAALPSFGTDLAQLTVTPYVIDATKIATHTNLEMPEKKCPDLLDPDAGIGLVKDTDYFKLADFAPNTFAHGKSYLLVLEGCPASASALGNAGKCGPGWSGTTSNLTVKVIELDSVVANMAKMGTQFVHASAIMQAGYAGGAVGAFGSPDAGGLFSGIQVINAAPGQYGGAIQPSTASGLTAPALSDRLITSFLFNDAGTGAVIPIPVAAVEQLSTGVAPVGIYKNGDNFTYIIVGDPGRNANGTQYFQDAGQLPISVDKGYAFHALGFSNNPVIKVCPPDCP